METTLNPTESPFMRPPDVAEVLGVNIKTVLRAIHAGEIPCTKLGQAFLVPTAWVVRQALLDEPTG